MTLKVILIGSYALASKKYENVVGICHENLARHLIVSNYLPDRNGEILWCKRDNSRSERGV